MEKYVILLLLLAILCTSLMLLPVWGRTADRTFLVCSSNVPAKLLPRNCESWRTKNYTVFLLEEKDGSLAYRLPHSRTVREYFLSSSHTIAKESAMMQVCVCQTHIRCGVPYLVD